MANGAQPAVPSIRLAEIRRRGEAGGVISKWVGDGEARAKMRARVVHLARIPRAEWDKKHFRSLHIPKCKGIYELKWRAEGKEFRAAGYDHGDGYFVMVFGFTHKGNVYDPPGWREAIRKNRKDVDDGYWEIIEF